MPAEAPAPADRMPDFIIGGAMKCATSSLHHLLRKHDEVHLPDSETHFFCMDDAVQHTGFFFPARRPGQPAPDFHRDLDRNLRWYGDFFALARPGQCVGDYSSTYLPAPDAARRIHALLPDAKLIFMLRNPIDRTYSHYWHRVKTGRAAHAFEYELQHGPSTLLQRSFYKPQLERYYARFPRAQIKVFLFEHFVNDTQAVIDEVCTFLGLSSSLDVNQANPHQNRSPIPRWHGLQLFLNYCTTGLETHFENELPYPNKPQASYIVRGLVHHLRKLNLTPRRKPPMSPRTRHVLAQLFARANRGLSDLIGMDVSEHWPFLTRHSSPREISAAR